MSHELLKHYSWPKNEYLTIPGTEDWIEVATLGEGGYDWAEFNAFYSPSARRYFWHGDSGCSCNSWEDGLSTAADFENGDRDALIRAWKDFAKENTYNTTTNERQSGTATIRSFKEPK